MRQSTVTPRCWCNWPTRSRIINGQFTNWAGLRQSSTISISDSTSLTLSRSTTSSSSFSSTITFPETESLPPRVASARICRTTRSMSCKPRAISQGATIYLSRRNLKSSVRTSSRRPFLGSSGPFARSFKTTPSKNSRSSNSTSFT